MRITLLVLVLVGMVLLLNNGVSAAPGAHYVLGAPAWRVRGEATGGTYRVSGAGVTAVDSCCCVYLPCVLRK